MKPRVSRSWKELRPDGGRFGENVEEYVARISPVFNVPLEVAEQWLYTHYENEHVVANYAWIDYRKVGFECVDLPGSVISQLNVIEAFSAFVRERSSPRGYDELSCLKEDVDHWRAHGTWRTPPVVLDVRSLGSIPAYTDIRGPYQLVEGHTRLGNFFALGHAQRPSATHRVYLVRGTACASARMRAAPRATRK